MEPPQTSLWSRCGPIYWTASSWRCLIISPQGSISLSPYRMVASANSGRFTATVGVLIRPSVCDHPFTSSFLSVPYIVYSSSRHSISASVSVANNIFLLYNRSVRSRCDSWFCNNLHWINKSQVSCEKWITRLTADFVILEIFLQAVACSYLYCTHLYRSLSKCPLREDLYKFNKSAVILTI